MNMAMLCEAPQSNKNKYISTISFTFRLISTRTVSISHLWVHDNWRFSQAFLKTALFKMDFFSALALGPHWCYQTLFAPSKHPPGGGKLSGCLPELLELLLFIWNKAFLPCNPGASLQPDIAALFDHESHPLAPQGIWQKPKQSQVASSPRCSTPPRSQSPTSH